MQLAQTAAPGPSLSIACINLVANASDLPSAVSRALRRDPDKVVFIGQPSDVMVRTFRESGHLVEVLPAASEPPAGATLVLPLPTESMLLPTGDVVSVGSTVSICVRRPGKVGGKQMRWYAGEILEIGGGRALVELSNHPGEQANLGPKNIRTRSTRAA